MILLAKEAALVFIDYITGIEAQQVMNKDGRVYPARTDIDVPHTLIKRDDLRNSVAWIPAQYKQLFIQGFVEKVLMR